MSARHIAAVAVLAPCLWMTPIAFAQQDASLKPTIRVAAAATITAKPDRAEIDVGVVTQAVQARDAVSQNAVQVSSVLTALRQAAGDDAEVQTVSYTLTPTFRSRAAEEPVPTGYAANNIVRVTLSDLGKLGAVADAATHSGANRIQDIRFTLRDPQSVRLQALREAALKAKGEAEALAAALGVRIVRVLTVDESGPTSSPIRHIMLALPRARAQEASTPIEAGTLNVNADVTLTDEVGAEGHS